MYSQLQEGKLQEGISRIPKLLGIRRTGGILFQLPQFCLKTATQHWLGTRTELVATSHAQELEPQSKKTPTHRGCLVPSLRGTTVWPGPSVQCLCWRRRSGSFRTLCWGSSLVISLLILLQLHLKKQKQTKDQKTKKRITQISQIIAYTLSPLNCRPSHKRDNFPYRALKNQLSSLCVSGDKFCHLRPSADKNCFNLFIHLLILFYLFFHLLILECHIFSSNLDILVNFQYILKSLRPWFCGTIFFFTFSLIEKKDIR